MDESTQPCYAELSTNVKPLMRYPFRFLRRCCWIQGTFVLCFLLSLVCLGQSVAEAKDTSSNTSSNASTNTPELLLRERFIEVDRDLFLELVKLAKFNVHFHLEANRHQKWRSLTYPLARESGTALTFSATLIELGQLTKGLDNPARISRTELKKAVTCGITGNAISGTASALELAQNTWVMLKAKEQGYSPKRSLEFVKNIIANTDRLLEARERLAAEVVSSERRQVIDLESKMVRTIRQQLLFEFRTWSCHSRDQAWRENTFYTLDSMQNYTRMSAAIMAMKTFGNPEIGRYAVVTALVANSAATLNPIISNLAGVVIRKHQERKLKTIFPCDRPELPSGELAAMQEKLSTEEHQKEHNVDHSAWLRKVAELNQRSEKVNVQLDRETKEIERYRQIAQQQTVSGPLIGLTGVASATIANVAVYGYPRDIDTVNKLGFAGRITQGTGQAYALINTPYTIIRGMIRNRDLRRRGELPTQLLQERLERLNKFSAE